MRDYELIVIYKPDIKDDNLPAQIEGVSKLITDRGGSVTQVNQWGRRKLAYAIEGAMEGNYVLTYFKGEPKLINTLESNLKMSELILRHLVVRAEGPPPAPPAPPAAPPAAAAAAPVAATTPPPQAQSAAAAPQPAAKPGPDLT